MIPAAAVALGAVLLIWPAALNTYPLVFIDTVSYLTHTTAPEVPWDKTQAYGPFLHLFHWQWSLWPPILAQGLLASWLVWLVQRAVRGTVHPLAHLAACAALALLTSAPWFLATLMPDALTAMVPIGLFLLGFGRLSRREALGVGAVASLAVAAHLSHLPTAIALVALTLLLTRRLVPTLRAAAPLACAILFLLVSNWIGFGRPTLSPHGAVFLLARLQADGPAIATLRRRCPVEGWHLCRFPDIAPIDSDDFLWGRDSPMNRQPDGSPRPMSGVQTSPEARAIIADALVHDPSWVAQAMLGNTARQLALVRVGDTLADTYLSVSVRHPITAYFPPETLAAFDAGAQMRGVLPERAAPFLMPHIPVLIAALLVLPVAWWRASPAGRALLACAVVALLANAFATGALSKPHHRYQARIVWLLPLAVGMGMVGRPKGPPPFLDGGGLGGGFGMLGAIACEAPTPALPRSSPGEAEASPQ